VVLKRNFFVSRDGRSTARAKLRVSRCGNCTPNEISCNALCALVAASSHECLRCCSLINVSCTELVLKKTVLVSLRRCCCRAGVVCCLVVLKRSILVSLRRCCGRAGAVCCLGRGNCWLLRVMFRPTGHLFTSQWRFLQRLLSFGSS